ncbi:type II toxin-antitoxin system VapC family toxin [Paracoccus sp. WLY502]|uniref:type II toxin-antitoxin system VapC family toxin n=1 Tax=Paracoccus yibinensis TaxID=3068891 RepID=UPI002796BFB8|nr:type II toxin-antitoxin system VapC family toxin [Paracoccus sp. WLY502]MDQ1901857.1 type II toxin-antitoxin system VapC family toxin [Paracoccus sp. WLY502]
MTPVLVDANVLIDISTGDPEWAEWSADALMQAGRDARLVINPLIYSELSVAHSRIETLEALLPEDVFHREPLPWPAAFLAGKAFLAYRRRGGARRSPLPDFYIGAHAAIRGYRLLTRDQGRYSTYFPSLDVISPE